MTKRLIIDTDPGTDDTAAILLALASKELSVEAVTTVYGNGLIEQTTRNALIILEAAGRSDIPVFRGAGKPFMREAEFFHYIHGSDALGDANIPDPKGQAQDRYAALELVDRVMANPGEITLVALGPLTNVALALCIEPRMAGALAELVLMGGAVLTHGNVSEVATANLYADPEATAIVYQSGAPIVQVGLDVCRKVTVKNEQLERIWQVGTSATELLARITPQRIRGYAERGFPVSGGVQYNDLPAIAYTIDPGLFDIKEYHVRISTHEELTRGQTVADVGNRWRRPPNAKVLMGVDDVRLTEMFTARLCNYVAPSSVAETA